MGTKLYKVAIITVLMSMMVIIAGTSRASQYTYSSMHNDSFTTSSSSASISLVSHLKPLYSVPPGIGLNETSTVTVTNHGSDALNISVSCQITPHDPTGSISVNLSPRLFILPPYSSFDVSVALTISPDVVPGTSYNITIYARAKFEGDKGNVIEVTSATSPTVIVVGEHSYKLTIIVNQPDGSPTRGTIKVSYYYMGQYVPIYEIFAHRYTFYVIEGKYLVEAYLGGMRRVYRELDINSDVTIELKFSTIVIKDISPVSKPRSPYDSFIFMVDIVNEDPLIYKKIIAVTASISHAGEVLVNNESIAELTIRSSVRKSIYGFIPAPEDGWENGTYSLTVMIISRGVILYNHTISIPFEVSPYAGVEKIAKLPFKYLLIIVIIGILFGFIGAKIGVKRIGREYIPKAVGLIYGGRIVAYNVWDKEFTRPELISGEWQKIMYGFNVLSKRYWRKKEKPLPITLALNSEKWIFCPLAQDLGYFICVHAALNEYDIREALAYLKQYFSKKIQRYGIRDIFNRPVETLGDIYNKIKELFL